MFSELGTHTRVVCFRINKLPYSECQCCVRCFFCSLCACSQIRWHFCWQSSALLLLFGFGSTRSQHFLSFGRTLTPSLSLSVCWWLFSRPIQFARIASFSLDHLSGRLFWRCIRWVFLWFRLQPATVCLPNTLPVRLDTSAPNARLSADV